MDDAWVTGSAIGERFPAWTRGNAADVFPEPISPLMQSLYVRRGLSTGLRDGYISYGALDWDEYEHPEDPELFKCFGGYLYNPLSLTRLMGARMPGVTPELIDKAFFDDRDDVPPYEAQDWHESEVHAERLAASMAWAMSVESLPQLDADREQALALRAARPDLGAISDGALIAHARSLVPHLAQMFETGMIVSSLASLGPGALGAICEGIGDPSLTIRLLAGIEVDSGAPSHAMWGLATAARESTELTAAFAAGADGVLQRLVASDSEDARSFLAGFERLLYDYGSRGPNEWDVIAATWEVRPATALGAIDRMRVSDPAQAPALRHAASVAERDRIAAEIRERLAGDDDALATFTAGLRSAQLFLGGRERYKTNCIMVVGEMRMALRELGRRFVERGLTEHVEQVFMLTDAELDHCRLDPECFRGVLATRWAEYRELFDIEPIFAINGHVPPLREWPRRTRKEVARAAVGDVLTGAAGSGGVATGRARVILDAADPGALEPGEILIAPQTDPAWTPLFVPAAAVIVNVGAMGSHAMIVCRELGIPCVASVQDATARIADGAVLTVDGNAGTVTVIGLP
jgi:pyruvate,water dikinase